MSSSNTITPNIISTATYNKCVDKCDLQVDFSEQVPTIENMGSALNIKRTTETDYTKYAGNDVKTQKVQVLYPCPIQYNTITPVAAIQITFEPITSGTPMVLIIPVSTTGSNTAGGDILSSIIDSASSTANSSGMSTSAGIPLFTLNKLIPTGSIYMFSMNSSSGSNVNYLCGANTSAIAISTGYLAKLKQIIPTATSKMNVPSTISIFKNENGIVVGPPTSGDNIYIDCQPVGSSEQEVGVGVSKNIDQDLGRLFENPIFLGILGGIVGIVLIYVLYTKFAKNKGGPGEK